MPNTLIKSESKSVASGFVWTSLSQAVRLCSQIIGLLILARLLSADDFGIIAMATVVTGFTMLFRDFGTTAALIQRPTLTPQLLDSVFWFNIAVGLGFALALTLLSPIVAVFFSESRLRDVLWLLSLVFPISSSALVHQALLERASNFKPVSLIESSAALLGLGSAIWAARSGWGIYSLVTQTLVSAAITTTGLWLLSEWRPGKNVSLAEIKGLWNFSKNLMSFNVVNYFARNADNILIGRFLGATDLGLYSMAYRLMLWPLQNISSVVGRAMFPAFCRMQTDSERLAAAYLRATAAISLISFPVMLGLFVLRVPAIDILLGHQWLPVANLLAWLAPVGLLQSIQTTTGILFMATGRTDIMFRWGVFASLADVVTFAIGIHWGLRGLVIGYATITLILFLPCLIISLRLIELKVSKILLNLLPSTLVAVVMAVVVSFSNQLLGGVLEFPNLGLSNQILTVFMEFPKLRLGVLIALGVLTYGVLSYFFQRKILMDILNVLRGRI